MTISLSELKNDINTLQNRMNHFEEKPKKVEETPKAKINFNKEIAKVVKNLTISGLTKFGKIGSDETYLNISAMNGFIDGYEISVEPIKIERAAFKEIDSKFAVLLSHCDKKTYETIKAENKRLIKNNDEDYFFIEIVKLASDQELKYSDNDKNLIVRDNVKSIYICNISTSAILFLVEDKRTAIALNGVYTVAEDYMPPHYDCVVKNKNALYINGKKYLSLEIVDKLPEKPIEDIVYLVAEDKK